MYVPNHEEHEEDLHMPAILIMKTEVKQVQHAVQALTYRAAAVHESIKDALTGKTSDMKSTNNGPQVRFFHFAHLCYFSSSLSSLRLFSLRDPRLLHPFLHRASAYFLITLLPLPPPLLVNLASTARSYKSVVVQPLLAMPTTSALGTDPLEFRFNKVIESLVDRIDLSEEEAEVCLKLLLNEANEALISAFSKRGNVDNMIERGIMGWKMKWKDTDKRRRMTYMVDMVKDGGHTYFIKFHDSMDAYAEQRAMAAFVLAVVVDGHRRGQEACIQANLLNVCLKHLQISNPSDGQTEPLLLHGFVYVRASAIFALGILIDVASITFDNGHRVDEDFEDNEKLKSELNIIKNLLQLAVDGSPLVRTEVAVGSVDTDNKMPTDGIAAETKTLHRTQPSCWILHLKSKSRAQWLEARRGADSDELGHRDGVAGIGAEARVGMWSVDTDNKMPTDGIAAETKTLHRTQAPCWILHLKSKTRAQWLEARRGVGSDELGHRDGVAGVGAEARVGMWSVDTDNKMPTDGIAAETKTLHRTQPPCWILHLKSKTRAQWLEARRGADSDELGHRDGVAGVGAEARVGMCPCRDGRGRRKKPAVIRKTRARRSAARVDGRRRRSSNGKGEIEGSGSIGRLSPHRDS
ncbi:hypothetical protein ZIOFF_060272 [Zingiber officinale]|uniref:Uncharacterized protein n=1 Tax=Zingiber officinale TaxID=94328 RepID=A0A8J5FEE6_ZINOF|nr:hypothetical protein ZIOFF_060272 [Zingiber officinale]